MCQLAIADASFVECNALLTTSYFDIEEEKEKSGIKRVENATGPKGFFSSASLLKWHMKYKKKLYENRKDENKREK
jgi:hypothetical protein